MAFERLHRCVLRLQRLAKPVIGSMNGVAVGAGCNIALATDLRIASDAARFGEVFTRVGLVPDGGGTYFLPRLVGTAKAMELMLLADIIDAQEALRLGLVHWVVPADQLRNETQKLAERLAQGPTLAYGLAKTGLYQSLTMPEDVLNMEARNQTIACVRRTVLRASRLWENVSRVFWALTLGRNHGRTVRSLAQERAEACRDG